MEPGPKWLQIIWCCLFGHQHCICKLQCKFLFPSGGLDILFHYSTSYSVKAEHNSATQILQYKHCNAVGKNNYVLQKISASMYFLAADILIYVKQNQYWRFGLLQL